MGLFEHWPYVNFHELNLDWIIKQIPKVFASRDEAQEYAESSAESAAASQLSAEAAQESQEAAHTSELNAKYYAEHREYLTPEMFGAAGDGTTDDTEALQDAINAGFQQGKSVYLTKDYLITEPIQVTGVSSTLTGTGSELLGNGYSRIIAGPTLTNIIETVPATDTRTYGIKIKDITIEGGSHTTNGIYSGYAIAESIFENLTIKNCTNGLHINGNCYLNNFRSVRTYNCTDYGIIFETGNNTSNIFEKCYVDSSANAYKLNGQYTTMISCCADVISNIVFDLSHFKGTLVACGSESSIFTSMFTIGSNSIVNIVGGMFFANPTLADYYINVAAASRLIIDGAMINYTTQTQTTGALCNLVAQAKLIIRNTSIYKPFTGENYLSATSELYENTAIRIKTISVTLDENNEADLDLNPQFVTAISAYAVGRTGYHWIIYNPSTTTTKIKAVGSTDYVPNIANKDFDLTIRYIRNSLV